MTESIAAGTEHTLDSSSEPLSGQTAESPRGTAWKPDDEQACQAALTDFLSRWPEYRETERLDRLRLEDFTRLDRKGHVYLDYTGGGLYGESLVRRHAELLCDHVFGNPHSTNPTSSFAGERVETCRRRVLEYFNGSPDEYVVIFTSNASHSLKLVGESYPFECGDQFLLTFDNHNSVNGIREYDRTRGAETTYVPVVPPDMRVDDRTLDEFLERARPNGNNLFAYPAQSNFSGVQHSLEWIERAHAKGWDVLLDAAAFVPTNRLDLGRYKPDYVALSFYKMFGFPTGVGALIGRHEALAKLHRPWFAGGTIQVASVQADRYTMAQGAAAFEDGTPNYEILPAVDLGLELMQTIGIETIHERVRCLTGWLIEQLVALRHGNGRPLIKLYGPEGTEHRGGTITFNVFDDQGHVIDHDTIEHEANLRRISLRTGCFCNPGAGELALGLSREELVGCFDISSHGLSYNDFRRCVNSESTGAVRVSLGMVSDFADAWAFVGFMRQLVSE